MNAKIARVVCSLLLVLQLTPTVFAASTTGVTSDCGGAGQLSCAQHDVFALGVNYFDVNSCGNGNTSASSSDTTNTSPLDKTYTDASRSNRTVGATIYFPTDGQPHPLIIFAPGQKQNSKSVFYSRYLQATANAGFIVAGANFADNTSSAAIPSEAADIKFLIGQVLQDTDIKNQINPTTTIGVIGHSDGGYAALLAGYGTAAGQQDDRIGAVIEQDGALYPGASYQKGPSLLIMHGSNDKIEPPASAFAVNSIIKTPYTAFAEFNNADHNSYITGQPSAQDNLSYAQFNGAVDTLTKAFLDRELNGTKNNGTSLSKIVAGQYATQVSFSQSGDENITPGLTTSATTVAATSSSASSCCASGSGLSGGTLPTSVPAPYNAIFTDAAQQTGADPLLIAAIFLSEHGYSWPNPPPPYGTGPAWATSIVNGQPAAEGPFQFLPTTWIGSGKGGNIQDLKDAAAGAGRYLVSLGGKSGIPVGSFATSMTLKPSVANVLGSYNAGPAGDFNNSETTKYITDGLAAYTKMAAGQNPVSGGVATPVISGGAVTDTAALGCAGGGAVAGNIIATAEGYAWPTFGGHSALDSATPAYKLAWDGASNMTDCAAFVGTVMIKSGVDPHFPPSGVKPQYDYVKLHPELYQIIEHPTSTAQLQPGDLLIHVDGVEQHSMIYIGDPKWQGADASYSDNNYSGHTPQVSPNVTWVFAYPSIIAARYIGGGASVTQPIQ